MADQVFTDTKISVVIPFYNRIGWTIEAIRSVQAQTHQNFEILLVDDGSTDSVDSLMEVVRLDPRIRYMRQENTGPSRARNLGIDHAHGEYIAFLDADDLFYPEKLAVQLAYMEDTGHSLCHTSYQRIDLEGNVLGAVSSGTLSGQVFPGIMASCPIAMPTVMGTSRLFKSNHFPEALEIGEDVCLWIKLTSQYPLGAIDDCLSRVRVGPATAALNKRKQAIGFINIAAYIVHDDYLSQYQRQLKSLLIDAASILSDSNAPSTPTLTTEVFSKPTSVLSRVYRSLQNDGFLVTAGRIRRRIG
jgi:glycosyltransferase involved in cell wall biosynthesis